VSNGRVIVCDEMDNMCKEADVAYFKILSQHVP
jgi:hypothetical protein